MCQASIHLICLLSVVSTGSGSFHRSAEEQRGHNNLLRQAANKVTKNDTKVTIKAKKFMCTNINVQRYLTIYVDEDYFLPTTY